MKKVLNFLLFATLGLFFFSGQHTLMAENLQDLNEVLSQEKYPLEIYMESDKNEYIGQGIVHHYKENVPPLSLKEYCGKQSLKIKADCWTFEFVTREGTLNQGVYLNAERCAFQKPTNPDMDVHGNARGYNKLSGEFTIIDIVYNELNQIISLALDLIQYGESSNNNNNPKLKAYIRYNSQIPIPKIESPLNISLYIPNDEWLGQSLNFFYETKLQNFPPVFYCKSNTISLHIGEYDFDFSTPKGDLIASGYYNNTQRHCMGDSNELAMDISGNGLGWNEIEGDFHVLAIEYDEQCFITTLAIDFVQYCEEKTNQPVVGSIRYNSNIPLASENTLLSKFNVHFNIDTDFFEEDTFEEDEEDVFEEYEEDFFEEGEEDYFEEDEQIFEECVRVFF